MKRGMRLRITLSAIVAFGATSLQPVAFAQATPVVLRAARMFDGLEIRSPGLVVVEGTTITGIGASAQVPAGARVLDFGDATLSPGFIDAHTHLSFPFLDDYNKFIVDSVTKTAPERALFSLDNAKKTLLSGITTVRDVGASDFIDVALRNAAQAGLIVGPRMLVSVRAIGATGGHCDEQNGMRPGVFGFESGPEQGVINGGVEARKAVRYAIKYGADVIKVCATGGVLSLTDPAHVAQLTQDELNALVDEAHTLERKTAAHAHGAEGAKRAIRAGIDSIEHGAFLDDEALDLMKARGTHYVPTLMALEGGKEVLAKGGYPPYVAKKMTDAMESINRVVRSAIAKGVKIALGTDAGVYPHGRNPEEFHLLTNLGMSPVDALRSGTSVAAELLGVQHVGRLGEGKVADIIAFPGDPRQNIRVVEQVFFVMKDGRIARNDR